MATDDYCLIKSKITFIWQIFLNSPHNGAMNYFDGAIAIGKGILSVIKLGGGILQKLKGTGKCVNFL